MTTVTIEEAQAKLAELIDHLASGEELVITRNQQSIARLLTEAKPKRKLRTADLRRSTYRHSNFKSSFSNAKPAENAIENVVGIDFAGDRAQFVERVANFDRQQLLVRLPPRDGQGPVEGKTRFLQAVETAGRGRPQELPLIPLRARKSCDDCRDQLR